MTTHRSIVLALIAGIAGVFVGRALPRDASKTEATVPAISMSRVTAPTRHDCKAEAVELFSTKMQLAICMAYRTPAPEAARSRAPETSEPEPLKRLRRSVRGAARHPSERSAPRLREPWIAERIVWIGTPPAGQAFIR
jgi:hypothetical protein